MSLAGFLRQVVEILEDAGIPYMLTGSLASAYYATPRATQDIDLVIDAGAEALDRAVAGLSEAGYYVDRDAAMEALESHGQFNAIDANSGWKVDLIIRKDRAFNGEFDRRQTASLFGVDVSLASLEDVLLAKLEWSRLGDSELQRRDVVQLLERAGSRLDLPYVERWVTALDVSQEWEDAKTRVSDGLSQDDDAAFAGCASRTRRALGAPRGVGLLTALSPDTTRPTRPPTRDARALRRPHRWW